MLHLLFCAKFINSCVKLVSEGLFMLEKDYEMALSDEDLIMLILGIVAFILSFSDIRSRDSIAAFSFPSIFFFLLGWGITRFRRRPLPKQVHHKRAVYLAHIKVTRNYLLLSIITLNIMFFARYVQPGSNTRIGMIFQYVSLFFISLLELFGHVVASDDLLIIPELETDNRNKLVEQRRKLLFGTHYLIWLTITMIITIGFLYLSISPIVAENDLWIYVAEILSFILSFGLYYYVDRKTMKFDKIMPADMVAKAVDYYNLVGLRDWSYKLITNYLKYDAKNVGILSKYAFMLTEDQRYTEVPKITKLILEETEQKGIKVPHIIAKAYLLYAISLSKMEKYSEAYNAVTRSLQYVPENNVARKLRRELRNKLKMNKDEK